MEAAKVRVEPSVVEAVFKRVAKNQSSTSYLEFINEVRGQMSREREGAVEALFKDMDIQNRKEIASEELVRWFKPENHPDVLSKRTSADAIYDDFVDSLDLFGRLGGFDFQNRTILYEEFMEFFDSISALESNDDRFFQFVNDCFA